MKPIAVAAILIATLLATPSFAKEEAAHPMAGGSHAAQMWKGLNLTAAQQQKMKELQAQDKPKMTEAVKAAKTEMKTLVDLFGDASADDAKLKAQRDKVVAASNEAMNLHFDHMLAVRAILTPEQRKKFAAQRMHHPMGMSGPCTCGSCKDDME